MGVLALVVWMHTGLGDITRATHGSMGSALALNVLVLGGISLALGVGTLLPFGQGASLTDGRRVQILWRPGAIADRHAAILALTSYWIVGRRPRDWDHGIVAQALSVADGSDDDVQGHHMAYLAALDRGNVQTAREHIQYMLDHVGSISSTVRPVVEVEVAYFEAAYCGDAAARRRLTHAGESPLLDTTDRLRSKGAVLLAERDLEGACETLREAYVSAAGDSGWGSEFIMVEIERVCQAHDLPDPSADIGVAPL